MLLYLFLMRIQQKPDLHFFLNVLSLAIILLSMLLMSNCARDFPALAGLPVMPPEPAKPVASTAPCSCPVSTTAPEVAPKVVVVDTLSVPPPHFLPDGGNFYMTTPVQVTADTLPPQAVIEVSADNGKTWWSTEQFTLTTGGTLLARIRAGTKLSRSRAASFTLYFKRMLIIGNSIMNHPPSPSLGWFNSNGMAASAPEKDFVHLLTAHMLALYPALLVKQQTGGNFEGRFGTPDYSLDEFNQPLQEFKPDLIVVRIGENVDDGQVANRNFEAQFRQLLERLASFSQPVRIVCTTSVWYKPNADAVIRKVTLEKGHTLVDLSFMIGQSQCFASQYQNPGVAAHPSDVGMQLISEMIWTNVQ